MSSELIIGNIRSHVQDDGQVRGTQHPNAANQAVATGNFGPQKATQTARPDVQQLTGEYLYQFM